MAQCLYRLVLGLTAYGTFIFHFPGLGAGSGLDDAVLLPFVAALGFGGAVGVIILVAEHQCIAHHILHFLGHQVVVITQGLISKAYCIFALRTSAGPGQEELAILALGTCVTVSHIHQVVLSAQADDVPHVPLRITEPASGEVTHDRVADGVDVLEGTLVAEVLEGLGITLAYHLCIRVAVKHIYYLPGIAVLDRFGTCGVVVILC